MLLQNRSIECHSLCIYSFIGENINSTTYFTPLTYTRCCYRFFFCRFAENLSSTSFPFSFAPALPALSRIRCMPQPAPPLAAPPGAVRPPPRHHCWLYPYEQRERKGTSVLMSRTWRRHLAPATAHRCSAATAATNVQNNHQGASTCALFQAPVRLQSQSFRLYVSALEMQSALPSF